MNADELVRYIEEEQTNPTDLAKSVGYSRASIYAMIAGDTPVPLSLALALSARRAGLPPYGFPFTTQED